jgi:hypothetical protein
MHAAWSSWTEAPTPSNPVPSSQATVVLCGGYPGVFVPRSTGFCQLDPTAPLPAAEMEYATRANAAVPVQSRVVPGGATANTRGALDATAENRTFTYQHAPSAVSVANPTLSCSERASTETSPRLVGSLFTHDNAGASAFKRVTSSVTIPSETIAPNTASSAVSRSAWEMRSLDCTRCPPRDPMAVRDSALTRNSTSAASRMVNARALMSGTVRSDVTASGCNDGDLNAHELACELTVEAAAADCR